MLGAVASLVVIGLVAALGVWKPQVVVPIVVAVTLCSSVILLILSRQWARRLISQVNRVRRQLDAAGGTKVTRQPSPTWKDHPRAKALVESHIFSQTFYERLSGKSFDSVHLAAAHYLTYYLQKLTPPNPFIDFHTFPQELQDQIRRGQILPVLDYLGSQKSNSLGPAFFPSFVSSDPESPVSPLRQFLGRMDSSTLLSVPADSPLHGVTAQSYADAVTNQFQVLFDEQRVNRPRLTRTWDHAGEAAWKETILSSPETLRPRVSVVMPVKNRPVLVRDAVVSIREQSYDNWELLIVDDLSTDETPEVLTELANIDARITVLTNTGSGVSAARNTGLATATGDYIAFLDSDNTWTPDYLELMIRGMLSQNIDWAYSGNRLVGNTPDDVQYMAYEGGIEDLLIRNHIDMNVMVISAELIRRAGGFDETIKRWVDFDLVMRLMTMATPVLFPFIGCNYDHSMNQPDRITVKESSRWQGVVLAKNIFNWERDEAKERVPGRVSVILPAYENSQSTIDAVESILDNCRYDDIEVIVVDGGSTERHARRYIQYFSCRDNIRLVRLARNFYNSIGNNYGYFESSGEFLLFVDHKTRMRSGTIADLVNKLRDDSIAGVNPVILKRDDTIHSAGVAWVAPGTLPLQFLEGHPLEDARYSTDHAFAAASATGLLMRAVDFRALHGFDASYVSAMHDIDLTLRAAKLRPGGFHTVPSVAMAHLKGNQNSSDQQLVLDGRVFMETWRNDLPATDLDLFSTSTFEAVRVGPDSSLLKPEVPTAAVTLGRKAGSPRRWSIKNPADPGMRGDEWGDTHFINSFAASLRQLDQEVVTLRHGAHASASGVLDDVSLVVRGLHRTVPIPGATNILWIISHPDKVSADELAGFDLVYAASHAWAEWATKEYGIDVRPLLQATDATRFFYADSPASHTNDLVFVGGNFAKRNRKSVVDAVESGVRLKVYGPGWEGVVPSEMIGGPYIENDRLADVYRDARFVLADHWDLMAREGFVQNRIFDAVASGCRVISDDVKDLDKVFGEEVLVYRTPDDIRRFVEESIAQSHGQAEARRREASQKVIDNHTFDARARQLVSDVEDWERRMKL